MFKKATTILTLSLLAPLSAQAGQVCLQDSSFMDVYDYNGDGIINSVDSTASNFEQELPVSEEWGRFNFSTEENNYIKNP